MTVVKSDNNLMVGVMEDIHFSEAQLQLQPGDSLVLYTDGVTEAFDEADQAYGDDRLEAFLKTQAGNDSRGIIDHVLEDVHNFVKDAPQSDDITMLTLTRKS